MRQPFIFLALIVLLGSCGASKTMTVLKAGKVEATSFTHQLAFKSAMDLVIIPVTIKGKVYQFVFDTGAQVSVISPAVRATLDALTVTRQKVYDSQGKSVKQEFVIIDTLSIAGVNFSGTGAIVSNLTMLGFSLCTPIDGILGANVMQHAYWAFDFKNSQLLLTSNKKDLPVLSNADTLSFKSSKHNKIPQLDLTLDGSKAKKRIKLDMGSSGTIRMGQKPGMQHNGQPSYFTYSVGNSTMGLHGRGQTDTTFYVRTKSVLLHSLELGEYIISYQHNRPAIIGMKVLRNYNLVLNWKENRLLLSKTAEAGMNPIFRNGFHFSFDGNRAVVMEIVQNSNAQKAGLQQNDLILTINGTNLVGLTAAQRCEMRIQPPTLGADKLSIAIRRGDQELTINFEPNDIEQYMVH